MSRLTFWFSQKHGEHYTRMNSRSEDKIRKNYINGILYTAYGKSPYEPYSGALNNFPDYVKVAEGFEGDIRTGAVW